MDLLKHDILPFIIRQEKELENYKFMKMIQKKFRMKRLKLQEESRLKLSRRLLNLILWNK